MSWEIVMPARQVQRLDTHHGLDGMGWGLVPLSNGIAAEAGPSVGFSGVRVTPQPRCGLELRPTPPETMMRFYNHTHRFYCGVDLHARTISLHILDAVSQDMDQHA